MEGRNHPVSIERNLSILELIYVVEDFMCCGNPAISFGILFDL